MIRAIRSTRVVMPNGIAPATVVIDGERIVQTRGWSDTAPGETLRDFGDLIVLPGLVDTHVHMNEPGRTEWEGFDSATRAAAAGGVTTLVDMPLNCVPETTSTEALEAKRRAAIGQASVDWAAWGGVVRRNSRELKALASAGVPGFKCFLIDSGIDGFAWVDEAELRLALAELRGAGLPLLAHAELTGPIDAALDLLRASNCDWRAYASYLASRPDAAETQAIELLIRLAEEFQTPIHIVHLATGQALKMIADARRRGVPLSVETCAHYLCFAAEEIPDGATMYKCAPPIREALTREALWCGLLDGVIDMVTTDHSPCPPAMKMLEDGRWDRAWGGIASLGLALPVLWTGMSRRGIAIEKVAEWMAAAPARLAGLSGSKGAIASGRDADFAIFDPDVLWTVSAEDLHFRHKISAYLGTELRGRVVETWLRGEPVFSGGHFAGTPRGREQARR